MKKTVATVMVATVVGMTMWFATPVAPDHYEMHVVKGGETITSIIEDANRNTDVNYDIREAVATSVAKSAKMEGGVTSRSIHPGEKIAVPIYK
jgi:hypothetical protein|nr:MAG TPA: hypothetical protein [Caudoviricetes sp.]DAV40701.1 MAG TPA: hypothetical protein [Caudoviricetes sp.]